ncbi:hypothetical protein HYALB_00005629 [Hymenoscyphus albidus]|uniref:Uncharacterized protein n=1 Tax=Hymenoscyphus albidus TaxID=595503 RepID=A0A9N9LQ54_9HELO|nr:hypothetical protein HYALB_00005629 [Hymenoscyphus albidus]
MAESSDPKRLCERCNPINLEDLKGADGYMHQPSFKALVDSASGCMLCKLIAEACVHYLHEQRVNIDAATGNVGPVRLFATGRKDRLSGMEVRNFAALRERQLSQNALVTVGELTEKLVVGPSRSILLEIYALKDSSAEEAGILRLREIESHATCQANFSRLRNWLEICKRRHMMCSLEHIQQLVGKSCMPKRLIDLGAWDASSTKPRIIQTRGRQEQYVALSYFWGTVQHFRTTNENFSELQKSIPVEQLPQTIRDAFFVAQKWDGSTNMEWHTAPKSMVTLV